MTDDRRDERSEEQAAFEAELERTRKLILERRNRFMAAALAGLGMTGGNACTRASVCLSLAPPQAGSGGQRSTAGAGAGAGGGPGDPDACPTQPWRQPPCVCLSAPVAGSYPPPFAGYPGVAGAGGAGAGGAGAGGSAGVAGKAPSPCLSLPVDEDAGVEDEP